MALSLHRPDSRRTRSSRLRLVAAGAGVVLAVSSPTTVQAHHVESSADFRNLVVNGNFERERCAGDSSPLGWTTDAWQAGAIFACDGSTAHRGRQSVRIDLPALNDARWLQTIAVRTNTMYQLSAWIKTREVTPTPELYDVGANISFWGTWDHSPGVFGTSDWTYVSVTVDSGDRTELTVAARLGYWSGTTTGTAWFDDVRLEPVQATSTTSSVDERRQRLHP